jgi:secretion/DNA translocation related CpaE-like protein
MTRSTRPLVVTADPELLDDMLRLCAAAGIEPEVASDASAARRSWPRAVQVLVGSDVAESLVRTQPVRRPEVVLVGRDPDDPAIWPHGLALGAQHVVFLPDAERWLVDRLSDLAEGGGRAAVLVAVVGGRGGAGASTLAAALALAGARRRSPTLLLDADPLGGGIDLVLGAEDSTGLRWPALAQTRGRVSGAALHEALPRLDQLAVLTWDRGETLSVPPAAMRTVLEAARRANDLVVVDLPRRLDDAAAEVLTTAAVALLVVPAEIRAAAAAARVASSLAPLTPDVRVVVRGPAPAGLAADVVAASLGLPLVGFLEPEPGLARALERGDPPGQRARGPLRAFRGPLRAFCGTFLDDLLPLVRDVAA